MSWQEEPFPWHLGVFDAHCHPTDTMPFIESIPEMHARVLTVMATRAEDQDLVSSVADDIGLQPDNGPLRQQSNDRTRIIPAFGWHPWFSYQMFDESKYGGKTKLSELEIIEHYQDVLVPKPEDKDKEFMLSLPKPMPFNAFLAKTKEFLAKHPLALVGEIGLDRYFRLPYAWDGDEKDDRDKSLTPGGREGRKLSPYHVNMEHQRYILKAQLNLAGEMGRAVSVHGVQVHGILLDVLRETWKGHERKVLSKRERKKMEENQRRQADVNNEGEVSLEIKGAKPYPPRICLHSYSGPPEQAQQYLNPAIPAEIFFSFSEVINFDKETSIRRAEETIRLLPDDKILVESDLHTAGPRMDEYLESIVRSVCRLKEWRLEDGVRILGQNWKRFALGDMDDG